MSYLDDPEHEWRLDPAVRDFPLEVLLDEVASRDWDGIDLILQGYAGLKQRLPNATDSECLQTSMIWYYG
jgi:hypothetical protein